MAIKDDLIGVASDEYGDQYRTDLLAMYKLYVEMADRISQRRQMANSFFLALNSAIVALVGYVGLAPSVVDHSLFYAIVAIAGIVLCYLWYRLIRSYKDINSGKFKVIHEIEAMLPIRPYDAEWTALGKGKDRKLYLPFTRIEVWVPWVFIAIHGVVLLRSIPWNILAAYCSTGSG